METAERTAVITGAGSGLGKDIALGLAAKDYEVWGTARSVEEIADLADADDRGQGERLVATIRLGGRVGALAMSRDGQHLYVAQPDSIVVIDTSHHILSRISIPAEVKELALDPSGSRLLAVHYGGSVSAINTADHLVKTIACDWNSDVVVSPDGRHIYAADNGVDPGTRDGVVAKIDTQGTMEDILQLVGEVAALALSPDGTRLYVISSQADAYLEYPTGRLTIIDTIAYAVRDTIAVAARPTTVTPSPDGRRLYLTHDGTAGISVVDLTTNQGTEVKLVGVPLGVTFSPDSTLAYLTHPGSLTVVDTFTLHTMVLATGEAPRGVLFSPDGKRAYITHLGDHTVVVVDTITDSVTTTLVVGGHPEAMVASPDGQRLYVGDYWAGTVTVIAAPSLQDQPNPSTPTASQAETNSCGPVGDCHL